jgi:hypothetical protein
LSFGTAGGGDGIKPKFGQSVSVFLLMSWFCLSILLTAAGYTKHHLSFYSFNYDKNIISTYSYNVNKQTNETTFIATKLQ